MFVSILLSTVSLFTPQAVAKSGATTTGPAAYFGTFVPKGQCYSSAGYISRVEITQSHGFINAMGLVGNNWESLWYFDVSKANRTEAWSKTGDNRQIRRSLSRSGLSQSTRGCMIICGGWNQDAKIQVKSQNEISFWDGEYRCELTRR